MVRAFEDGLDRAWVQYQDLYDKYMGLLRCLGMAKNIDDFETLRSVLSDKIDYALNEWSTPSERWEQGGYSDFGLDVPDEDDSQDDDENYLYSDEDA